MHHFTINQKIAMTNMLPVNVAKYFTNNYSYEVGSLLGSLNKRYSNALHDFSLIGRFLGYSTFNPSFLAYFLIILVLFDPTTTVWFNPFYPYPCCLFINAACPLSSSICFLKSIMSLGSISMPVTYDVVPGGTLYDFLGLLPSQSLVISMMLLYFFEPFPVISRIKVKDNRRK